MRGPLLLAWKYVTYNRTKTFILVACIFLTVLLPVAVKILLDKFESQIVSRADTTPAVIGARGSDLDLALSALYFKRTDAGTVPFSETATIEKHGIAIPVYSKFTAREFPVVATTLDYYAFRGLQIAEGNMLTTLGDCAIGSRVAAELGIKPGDQLLSDRETVLDIGGMTPLKMNVTGVFAPTNSADDNGVFVDLKTAWVIEGLGHGHQDLENVEDELMVMSRDDGEIVASPAVVPYLEITENNIDSFHFHGEMDDFPVSAIIAVTPDEKSETLLEGNYGQGNATAQFVRPSIVVRELMDLVFKVKSVFDANAVLIGVSTALLLLLVILLSLKLRAREMQTMFKIGASRNTNAKLQLYEMGFIFLISGILVAIAVRVLMQYSGEFVQRMLIG
ncbi:MAG: ABC transporter permease [Planctomycetota bacterium]